MGTHTEGSTYFIINRHNCCKYHRDSTCFSKSFSPNLILMQTIKWFVTSVNIYNQPKSATYKRLSQSPLPSLWSRGGQIDVSILSIQSHDLSINTTTIAPIGSVTKKCIHHVRWHPGHVNIVLSDEYLHLCCSCVHAQRDHSHDEHSFIYHKKTVLCLNMHIKY